MNKEQAKALIDSIDAEEFTIAVFTEKDILEYADTMDITVTKKRAKEIVKTIDIENEAVLVTSWDEVDKHLMEAE